MHTDESVFTVLLRKCGSFREERTMDSTHFLFRRGKVYPLGYASLPYLYRCGVLDVICLLPGFTTTSLEQMKSAPHFLFITTPESGVGLGKIF